MCFSIAVDAACCASSIICQFACCCCKQCLGTTFKEQIKLAYIILNIVLMLFTVICLYWIQGIFSKYTNFFDCVDGNTFCLGVSAIYRMSFVLACLYILLILFMLCRGEVAKAANEDFWMLKFIFIGGAFYLSLYIPNSFFIDFITISRLISGQFYSISKNIYSIYLVFQIIMLIDVFYLWGQNWIGAYEQGNSLFIYLLVIFSIILYSLAITLNVHNFKWFKDQGQNCSLNSFMNVFTIILIVSITAVQLIGWNPQGSLLCSGSMALYMTYQSYTAQASGSQCNSLSNSQTVLSVETGVGFILSTIALLYLTFATKESSSKAMRISKKFDLTSGFLESQESKNKENNFDDEEEQDHQRQQQQYVGLTHEEEVAKARQIIKQHELEPYMGDQFVIFHIVMFITVIYMSMMLTNWGAPDLNAKTLSFQPSQTSYWIGMLTSWTAAGLYIWTLIAPQVFPQRDFSR